MAKNGRKHRSVKSKAKRATFKGGDRSSSLKSLGKVFGPPKRGGGRR